jgi:hypothetical protein
MLLPVTRLDATRWARACGLAAVLALAFSGAVAGGANAATLQHTVHFDAGRIRLEGAADARGVEVPGLSRTWDRGAPELPFELVTLVVPQGSQLVGLRAHATGEVTVAAGIGMRAASTIFNDDGAALEPRVAKPVDALAAVAPRAAYPAALAEFSSRGALHGYQLLSLRVYPVRWDAASGTLTAVERIDLELDLAAGGPLPLERERYSPGIEATARHTLERLVANPQALAAYERRIGVLVDKQEGGFQPTDAPSLEGSDVDYVVITGNAQAASWQAFADWKTRRGIPTVVRTTEWIQANYLQGSDLQETIRTFIKDAYAKWGVRYVLLAGDTDVLPARFGFSGFGEVTQQVIPTDTYFACLDGNWNKDGDAVWGEGAVGVMDPGDDTDLYAEVFVGRAPVSTAGEIANLTGKIIGYENPTATAYQAKALFLGEVLFPVDWEPGQPISMDGASFCEEMVALLSPCSVPTRLYQNYTDYPGSIELTLANAIAEMNAGPGFVNHIGHGYRYNMSCGDRSFQNFNALALTNGDKRFVLYMLNCTATAYDFPCLAEAFLDNTNGGAVGVLGASRAAYALPSRNYNRGFVAAVHDSGYINLGEAFIQSRLAYTPNAWFDTADHYSHLLYNFLGDPEMVMHTCNLGTTAVTHPPSLGLGLTDVTVHVTVGGMPRANARVCLQKGTEEYEFGLTDAGGDVVLPFRAESAGSVQVTVSGQNMTTYLGTISVGNGGGAYVSVQSLTVDDNSSGLSNGNSDGVIDAGESIELSATFGNTGNASATTPSGIFRVPTVWASVPDSTYALPTIGAGGSGGFTNAVRFTVPSNAPDGTVLPLTFLTTGAATWTDIVNRVVHAPDMRLTRLDIDDFAPGGNGDGVIQAGETFDLLAYFKNYGTGAADGLNGNLFSIDPQIVIVTGAASFGRCNPMQEITGATRFRVQETSLDANPLTLTLTDNRGRTLVVTITLRGPAPPAAPELDASTGANVVVIDWPPSTEPDLAGYHVYRATAPGGPWTRATVDRLARVAYFRNIGLNPSTLYYFHTTALDSSGNESAPSPTSSINTNPAQLNGWPIGLGAESSCSPAIGDITGDGSREIVAGNDHLYAWNNNGIELRDDDLDPQTWGIFADEVQIVTGAVALGEIDRSAPGFEVFVTSWEDSNKAFAVQGDGAILHGWPQRPDVASPQKGYWADSAVMDVDADGLAEVWAPAKNGNLYAWHGDGSPLAAGPAFKSGLGTYMRCSPSFANLDGDPYQEIVFGSATGVLNIWNHDGTNFGTFPKTPGTSCFANTAIGDVNADGTLDVVYLTEGGAVNIYDTRTGNQLPGFPVALPIKSNPKCPSPALADFNFDGLLEIVVAFNHVTSTQSQVRVLNHLGQTLPGWPIIPGGHTSESSPIVADVSGDGVPDILFGNEGGLLYGWSWTGQNLQGFPLTVNDFIRSVPYADDVDADGSIDVVLMGWNKNLYIWDFPVPYSKNAAQWPTLKHDQSRSGLFGYRIDQPTDTGDDEPPAPARVPAAAFLAQNTPNPFNPTTRIEYGIPAGATLVDVQLEIYDVQGRRVRTLIRGQEAPGMHASIWDGRDDSGQRMQSGIYFYRLQAGDQTLTRKMMLVK